MKVFLRAGGHLCRSFLTFLTQGPYSLDYQLPVGPSSQEFTRKGWGKARTKFSPHHAVEGNAFPSPDPLATPHKSFQTLQLPSPCEVLSKSSGSFVPLGSERLLHVTLWVEKHWFWNSHPSISSLSPGFKCFVLPLYSPSVLRKELSLNKYPADSVKDQEVSGCQGYLKMEWRKRGWRWSCPGGQKPLWSTPERILPW